VKSSIYSAAASLRSTLGRLPEMTVLADTMTMFRNLRFALNSAWQSFWRNLAVSLAAVLSITLILILGGVNLLIGHALSQVLDGFREKVSVISINVADDTPLPTVYGFQQQLASDPRVAGVKYITKEQALANFTADPNNAILAQQLQGNPLDAKLEVRVRALSDVAAIDTLAREGDPQAFEFPVARLEGHDFSFSGVKTALLYAVRALGDVEARRADLAASYQRAIVRALVQRTRAAAAELGAERIAIVGGVAANSELRASLPEAVAAPLPLCTDNAAMIGSAARFVESLAYPDYLALDAYASSR